MRGCWGEGWVSFSFFSAGLLSLAIPCEDPEVEHPELKVKGDNDPVDVAPGLWLSFCVLLTFCSVLACLLFVRFLSEVLFRTLWES